MRYYETIYITNPNLDNNNLNTILVEVGEQLNKTKSEIINHYNWGKKRLAYSIDNQKYGFYIILQYKGGDKSKMKEFEIWMKLNSAIIRHMTTVLENKPLVYIEDKEKNNDEDSKMDNNEGLKIINDDQDNNKKDNNSINEEVE